MRVRKYYQLAYEIAVSRNIFDLDDHTADNYKVIEEIVRTNQDGKRLFVPRTIGLATGGFLLHKGTFRGINKNIPEIGFSYLKHTHKAQLAYAAASQFSKKL